MELVASFIDQTVAGHKGSDFFALFLNSLGKIPANGGMMVCLYIRCNLLRNKQNFGFFHEIKNSGFETGHKIKQKFLSL